ncbi:MAG: hypothetical protein ACM3OB_01140 [Acidobacteriota bacterium]
MFYLGLRSSAAYLAALDDIRARAERAHVVTVAGGGAFLHALSAGTRSLTVVDADPDALEHWALVRTLLLAADSLRDFLRLLSGFETSGELGDPARLFTRPVDLSARLAGTLEPRLHELYRRTYGGLAIDRSCAVGRLHETTVKFVGFDLARDTFCWRFGEGAWRDEASFAALQAVLRGVPQRTLVGRLEEIDYGRLPLGRRGEPLIFLASNCESPLFTRGDRIFRRVLDTASGELRYVSWHRDLRLDDPRASAPTPEAVLARRFPAQLLRLAGERPLPEPLAEIHAERTHRTIAELLAVIEYGAPLLVVDGGRPRPVLRMIAALAPTFKRILWRPPKRCGSWRFPAGLRASYDRAESPLSALWSFTLRGLRDEPRSPTP